MTCEAPARPSTAAQMPSFKPVISPSRSRVGIRESKSPRLYHLDLSRSFVNALASLTKRCFHSAGLHRCRLAAGRRALASLRAHGGRPPPDVWRIGRPRLAPLGGAGPGASNRTAARCVFGGQVLNSLLRLVRFWQSLSRRTPQICRLRLRASSGPALRSRHPAGSFCEPATQISLAVPAELLSSRCAA